MIPNTHSEIQVSVPSHFPSESTDGRDFRPLRVLYDPVPIQPSALQHARASAKRGWFVFPVVPDGKRPLVKKWEKEATTDTAKIEAWWEAWPDANYGIACGPSGLFVVDVDVKKGKRGTDTLADLELEGLCPPTFEVETPSGGWHLYYRGVGPNSSEKLGPGIDTRGQGGYVVGPGARINGKSYTIRENREIADALPELIARCASTVERSEGQSTEVDLDNQDSIRRAADFLQRTSPAIEGHGGDNHTYKTACVVRDFGISQDTCLDLMAEHFNPRCKPPWPADELGGKVANAYDYAKREPGEARSTSPEAILEMQQLAQDFVERSKVPANDDEPGGIDQAAKPKKFRRLTRSQMRLIPPPVWQIEDTITEQSVVMIYGQWGSYKSFLALDMGLHVACNIPWCGKSVRPGAVIYCAGEGVRGVNKRVTAWEKSHGLAAENFELIDNMPLFGNDDEFKELGELLSGEPRPELVVFDTVAHAMAGMNENAQEDASLFMDRCVQLARQVGCTVLIVHHAGKDVSRGSRGSSAFPAACDTILEVSKPKPMEMQVSMPKQKDDGGWNRPLGLSAEVVPLDEDGTSSLVFQKSNVTPSRGEMAQEAWTAEARRVLNGSPRDQLPMANSALANMVASNLDLGNKGAVQEFLRKTAHKRDELKDYVVTCSDAGNAQTWAPPQWEDE